jgi:DNA polymerase III alpha subunit
MIQARDEGGRFSSIYDFAERVGERGAGKRVVESLVCAGAFDSFKLADENLCQWRANLHATVERALDRGGRKRRERDNGQGDMFGSAFGFAPDGDVGQVQLNTAAAWSHKELLANEKAAIGFYVSGHPLEDFLEKIEQLKCCTVADLASAGPETRVRLAGVVSDFTVRNTKKGDKYAYFRLEDLSGATIKCVLWPEAFKSKGRDAANDALMLVTGRLDDSDTASTVVCDEVYLLEKARIPAHNPWLNRNGGNAGVPAGQSVAAGGGRSNSSSSSSSSNSRVIRSLVIELPTGVDIGKKCEAIAQALRDSPGDCEVFLELHLREEGFRVRAQPSRLIRVCQDQRLDDALAAAGVSVNWVEMNSAS